MEVAHGHVVVADVAEGGPGRGVDVEASVFAQLADAEEVGCVGDDDDVTEIVFVSDGSQAANLLLGVDGVGFGDDVAEGYAIGEKIVPAYASFGVAGVLVAASAEGDSTRLRRTHPSELCCRPLATARSPAGTFSVITDPAAV